MGSGGADGEGRGEGEGEGSEWLRGGEGREADVE